MKEAEVTRRQDGWLSERLRTPEGGSPQLRGEMTSTGEVSSKRYELREEARE